MSDPARIVVLHGTALARQVVRIGLAGPGFELHDAETVAEAEHLVRSLGADAVLVLLSEEPGAVATTLEALADATAADPVRTIAVVPHDASAAVCAAIEAGAHDALAAPVDAALLRARVLAAVRTSRRLRALEQRARRDGLTGLWNRAFFDARIEEEVRESVRHGRDLSLVMCDIDDFKRLNDLHGHPFGDDVITGVARVLASGRVEDVPCRYGGEEFALILPSTPSGGAAEVAERARAAVAALAWPRRPELVVTASFGVCDLAAVGRTGRADALVAAADAAMYVAKRRGRNRVVTADPPAAGA